MVTGQNTSLVPILKDAETLDIDEDKIVLDRTVTIPNFTLEKYKKLRRSKISILSMNCFGGFTYHRFGLPFLSPIINMFASEEDFLKFLKNPIVDFESDLDCAFYVKPEFFGSTDFWKIIYWWGYSIHYDFWDMLLYGKKTPLIFKNK